jgi:alkaline phosphatase D
MRSQSSLATFSLRRWAVHFLVASAVIGLTVSCAASDDDNDNKETTTTYAFDYGVASGDPEADGVILWTRVTPSDNVSEVAVTWEIATKDNATDETMSNVVASGTFTTNAARDYTVKVDADNLNADTQYTYRFTVGDTNSVVGHTRTLPAANASVEQLRFAVFSCANYPKGYFNPYDDAAKQSDLNAVIHLGDYFYEYGPDGYPSLVGRGDNNTDPLLFSPANELLTLADYRTRHGQYKQDADLQELHRKVPFITVWDDHETANDAWRDGAENHDETTEGSWTDRKAVALQAYHEWMPIRTYAANGIEDRERIYRSFDFGDLASLVMLDTRIAGRDQQISQVNTILANHNPQAFLDSDNVTPVNPYDNLTYPTQFVLLQDSQAKMDEALSDSSRSLLGATQETWLDEQVSNSTETWQIFGQQIIAAQVDSPNYLLGSDNVTDYLSYLSMDAATLQQALAGLSETQQAQILAVYTGAYGQPYNWDAWDGYGEAQRKFYDVLKQANNPIVLSGDTHNAWGNQLIGDNATDFIGVELATPGVSAPGLEEYLATTLSPLTSADPTTLETIAGVQAINSPDGTTANSRMQFMNITDRGYMLVTITPDNVTNEWRFVSGVNSQDYTISSTETAVVQAGTRTISVP